MTTVVDGIMLRNLGTGPQGLVGGEGEEGVEWWVGGLVAGERGPRKKM